jgi:triacylglycerol lipase
MHGLYGFNIHGPLSLHMQYWSSIFGILHKIISAEVIVTVMPSTGSIASPAEQLSWFLQANAPRHGTNNASTSASESSLGVSGSVKPLKPS